MREPTPPVRVEDHAGLVHRIARRYAGRQRGTGLDLNDLAQAGFLGAMRAAESFDPAIAKWSTYASYWVRTAIQREIANRAETVRLPIHLQERRRKAGEKMRATVFSLDRRIGDDSSENGATFLDQTCYAPGEGLASEPDEAEAKILALVARTHTLTDRQREVLTMRAQGVTLTEIGQALGGLSRERIRQIEAAGIVRVRRMLVDAGELDAAVLPSSTRRIPIVRERAKRRAA